MNTPAVTISHWYGPSWALIHHKTWWTVVVMGSGTLTAAAEHGNLGAVKLLLGRGKRTGDLDLD